MSGIGPVELTGTFDSYWPFANDRDGYEDVRACPLTFSRTFPKVSKLTFGGNFIMIGKTTSGKEIDLPLDSKVLMTMTELDLVQAFSVFSYMRTEFAREGDFENAVASNEEVEKIEQHYGGAIQFGMIARKYGFRSEADFLRTGAKLAIKKVLRV